MQEDSGEVQQIPFALQQLEQQQQQHQQQQQQQQFMDTMSVASSSRSYVDKARLIKLVHENPILWDCRLPNYKRADKSKTDQWNTLGALFNVSGERVQRTFTSLREIFRRELNNEKLLGRRFKSKWEFYKSMSFLRDVIRERKPRERHPLRSCRRPQLSPSLNDHQNDSNDIDEYQYFAPNDPNNPSLQQQQQQQLRQQQQQQQQPQQQREPMNSSIDGRILLVNNASQMSALSLLTQMNGGNATASGIPQQQQQPPLQQSQQSQQQQQVLEGGGDDEASMIVQRSRTSSTTTPSIYIKDEIEIPDDEEDDEDGGEAEADDGEDDDEGDDEVDEVDGEGDGDGEGDTESITFNGEILYTNNSNVSKLRVINPIALKGVENGRAKKRKISKRPKTNWKRIARNGKTDGGVDFDDRKEDDEQIEISSADSLANGNSNLRQSKGSLGNEQHALVSCGGGGGGGGVGAGSTGVGGGEVEANFRRHLMYTKFADFIVAKMDSMNERDANDLMDRMMLVIAQKH